MARGVTPVPICRWGRLALAAEVVAGVIKRTGRSHAATARMDAGADERGADGPQSRVVDGEFYPDWEARCTGTTLIGCIG